jgi:hypothetical protein
MTRRSATALSIFVFLAAVIGVRSGPLPSCSSNRSRAADCEGSSSYLPNEGAG